MKLLPAFLLSHSWGAVQPGVSGIPGISNRERGSAFEIAPRYRLGLLSGPEARGLRCAALASRRPPQ